METGVYWHIKLPLLDRILPCMIPAIILTTYSLLILLSRIPVCLDLALDLSPLGFPLKIIYALVILPCVLRVS